VQRSGRATIGFEFVTICHLPRRHVLGLLNVSLIGVATHNEMTLCGARAMQIHPNGFQLSLRQ